MRRAWLTGIALVIASAGPVSAQPQTVNRTAHGQPDTDIRVGVYANVRPDCTAGPLPSIQLTSPPEHGKVTVRTPANATCGSSGEPPAPALAADLVIAAEEGRQVVDGVVQCDLRKLGGATRAALAADLVIAAEEGRQMVYGVVQCRLRKLGEASRAARAADLVIAAEEGRRYGVVQCGLRKLRENFRHDGLLSPRSHLVSIIPILRSSVQTKKTAPTTALAVRQTASHLFTGRRLLKSGEHGFSRCHAMPPGSVGASRKNSAYEQ